MKLPRSFCFKGRGSHSASKALLKTLAVFGTSHLVNYDVFLSFRGEDTRKNFSFYTTLIANGIRT